MKAITWKAVEVLISKIKPTPNNFKLKTDEGLARFRTSTKNYGLAGSVILNADFTLIDGNTRWEHAKAQGAKKIWASMPSRKLTPKEFTEFAAMYDMARAGEVDLKRIQDELGTSKDFIKKWGLEGITAESLNAVAELEKADIKKRELVGQAKEEALTKPITLLFTSNENEEFIKIAEHLYTKFKTDNLTDLALKVFRAVRKQK